MKKTLLTLCLFLAAAAGQAFASFSQDNTLTKDVMGNKRYTVSVSTGEGGQIEISGTGAISKNSTASATILTGEDVILVITPDEGYALKSFYVDGADKLADVEEGTYTITAIAKNMSVSATFEQSALEGDVNNDGSVNAADAVCIYNFINVGEDSGITKEKADVNGDGTANAADVVSVYNIIVGA